MPGRSTLTTVGAVIAVLLAIPGFFIGLYGLVGLLSLQQIVAGALGAFWGYGVVMGTYELIRRKYDRDKWREYADRHLLVGTIAVAMGLIFSGATRETMPGLAIVPALSAIIQANDGHEKKYRAWIHTAVLATGIGFGIYIYNNRRVAYWLEGIFEAMP